MNGDDFDHFTSMVASQRSRRGMLGLLGKGAIAGIVASALPAGAAYARKTKNGPRRPATTCKVQYPVKDLSNCPNRRPHPGYKPTVNGCGPAGVVNLPLWALIPDGVGELNGTQVNWKAACDTHDRCYGTCNTNKEECDRDLGDQLFSTCSAAFPKPFSQVNPLAGFNPEQAFYQGICNGIADIYVFAVGSGGGQAYDAAQKEACECCFPCIDQVYCNCNQTCYDDVNVCLSDCHVTLGCFTGICGPAMTAQCPEKCPGA